MLVFQEIHEEKTPDSKTENNNTYVGSVNVDDATVDGSVIGNVYGDFVTIKGNLFGSIHGSDCTVKGNMYGRIHGEHAHVHGHFKGFVAEAAGTTVIHGQIIADDGRVPPISFDQGGNLVLNIGLNNDKESTEKRNKNGGAYNFLHTNHSPMTAPPSKKHPRSMTSNEDYFARNGESTSSSSSSNSNKKSKSHHENAMSEAASKFLEPQKKKSKGACGFCEQEMSEETCGVNPNLCKVCESNQIRRPEFQQKTKEKENKENERKCRLCDDEMDSEKYAIEAKLCTACEKFLGPDEEKPKPKLKPKTKSKPKSKQKERMCCSFCEQELDSENCGVYKKSLCKSCESRIVTGDY